MTDHDELRERILGGRADAAIDFDELCRFLLHHGFQTRVRGSHHIFHRAGVEELVNLQRDGRHAKPYQVRQIRRLIHKYGL